MWIVPKTLSHFVQDTPGWSWELEEQAWMFAQSVTWRSKFMSKQYWLKRWKKGDYVQHLFGATLNPSMHDHFVESWTESQEASHVSHFQAPENEKDKKTQGTYGQASQMQFDFADPDGSSSKTCQDWLPLGCVTSCKTWDKWVIERRGAYSQRKKLARHTKGNECSSLRNYPTPEAHTVEKYSLQKDGQKKTQRSRNLTAMAINGELAKGMRKGETEIGTAIHADCLSSEDVDAIMEKCNAKNVENGHTHFTTNYQKMDASIVDQKNWATPQASDHIEGARTAKESNQKCLGRDLNQMKWATPQSTDGDRINQVRKPSELSDKAKKGGCRNLREDVQNWPTPRAGNPGSRKPGTGGKILAEEAKKNWPTPLEDDSSNVNPSPKRRDGLVAKVVKHNGLQDQEKSNTSGKNHGSPKLNPSWVEQLMGLSTGWTDLGSWGMELSPKPQN